MDEASPAVRHLAGRFSKTSPIDLPPGKRIPRGWQAVAVPVGGSINVDWPAAARAEDIAGTARFRVSIALDEREVKSLQVMARADRRVLGCFDLRYAHVFQPFELLLDRSATAEALAGGLTLTLTRGTGALWLLADGPSNGSLLLPHLALDGSGATRDRLRAFEQRLDSLDSLQPFGWLEGCVLDALRDLGLGGAQDAHLAQFFDRSPVSGRSGLIHEDLFSARCDDALEGIESTLMFASLARVWPQHPAIALAVNHWRTWMRADGIVQDGDTLSAEGSYTVAYPMAVVARLRPEWAWLANSAVAQLRARRDALRIDDDLWLRRQDDGRRTFRNWARAAAWYLLGLVRTLIELDDPPPDLAAECRQIAEWAAARQDADGLWACFIGEKTSSDTSGSAGIAAALALGVKHGWLPSSLRPAAERTLSALVGHLTPDGFLGGVAQTNKAGEALQRSDYRVIGQFGMGMMGQLVAALR
jgi:hypothetical protein